MSVCPTPCGLACAAKLAPARSSVVTRPGSRDCACLSRGRGWGMESCGKRKMARNFAAVDLARFVPACGCFVSCYSKYSNAPSNPPPLPSANLPPLARPKGNHPSLTNFSYHCPQTTCHRLPSQGHVSWRRWRGVGGGYEDLQSRVGRQGGGGVDLHTHVHASKDAVQRQRPKTTTIEHYPASAWTYYGLSKMMDQPAGGRQTYIRTYMIGPGKAGAHRLLLVALLGPEDMSLGPGARGIQPASPRLDAPYLIPSSFPSSPNSRL